jgi:hypothetical protein
VVFPALRRLLTWLIGGRNTRDGIVWRLTWIRTVDRLYGKPRNREEAAEQARAILAGFADLPTADQLIPQPRRPADELTGGFVIVGSATVGCPGDGDQEPPAIKAPPEERAVEG